MNRIDEIDARLKSRMEEMDKRLADRLTALDAKFGQTTDVSQSKPNTVELGNAGARIRAAIPVAPTETVKSIPNQWETSKEELLQLMEYVKNSPHVVNNALYAAVAPKLQFFVSSDLVINAYATIKDGNPTIYILVGAIRYANIVSAAYVASGLAQSKAPEQFSPLPEIIESLARCVEGWGFDISSERACSFAEKFNLHLIMYDQVLVRKAKSLAAGLLIGILAHEYGHLALGHLYGQSQTLEISRNQEREADSFASSVISSSPFGEYIVLGSILWELVWVWQEKSSGGKVATTHPLASERLSDLIRANPTSAAELGFAVPEGTSFLSTAEMAAVGGQASSATAGNVKFDWTSGSSCAFGCLGECRGN